MDMNQQGKGHMPGQAPAAQPQPAPTAPPQHQDIIQQLIDVGYTLEEIAQAIGVDPAVLKQYAAGKLPDPPEDKMKILQDLLANPKK